MPLDTLQTRIRKLKCPLSLLLAPVPVMAQFRQAPMAESFESLCRAALEAARGIVPAVTVKTAAFLALGCEGGAALQRILSYAHELEYYVIADADLGETGGAGELMAEAFLGGGAYASDAVTANMYLGSEALRPLVEKCAANEREVIVLVRRDNLTAGEVMDLVSGDRLVHRAVAEQAARNGRKLMADCGFSRVMISVGMRHMSDLRQLRRRMETTFFYVTSGVSRQTPEDIAPAFDLYGHGALVETPAEFMVAKDISAELERLRDEYKKTIQIL